MNSKAVRNSSFNLQEAKRYLPTGSDQELEDFAARQLHARQRTMQLLEFYQTFPCHTSRIHLLTACALTLGRFGGLSVTFDAIGDQLMPVTVARAPRTALWSDYQKACSVGQPWQIRDELWLVAHCADLETLRSEGLINQFYTEADKHGDDPTWQLLRQHLEVTLGQRLMDRAAIQGMVAYETAIAQTMLDGVAKLFTAGWALLARFARETSRALLQPSEKAEANAIGYRQCAFELLKYSVLAWSAARVYQRGVRQRERGDRASEEGYPLLREVLGADLEKLSPVIEQVYRNPGNFDGTAHLELRTIPSRLASRFVTLLTGQGLYESHLPTMQVRFRTFRRADGSMHFLRELYSGQTFRVFDSDFAVRQVNGKATFCEIFTDMNITVEMKLDVSEEGGLTIQGQRIQWYGIPIPSFGLKVVFQSQVQTLENQEILDINGRLLMQPSSSLGRFLVSKILRRPELLACLHYQAVLKKSQRIPTL